MRVVVGSGHDPVDLSQADLRGLVGGLAMLMPSPALRAPAQESAIEPSGMASQSGRFLASYITS